MDYCRAAPHNAKVKHLPERNGEFSTAQSGEITTATDTKERRWIILGEDGRHATVGRHTDPTDDELVKAAEALRASGQGGWLAITEGHYYRPRERVSVMMVRELAPTRATWEAAVDAFLAVRRQATAAEPRRT